MGNQTNIIPASAMPQQTITPLAFGATSPMDSARIQQQHQVQRQMALIGKSGGAKRKRSKRRSRRGRKIKGGATNGVANNVQILVPSVQAGAVNQQQTALQYAQLTELASRQHSQAKYDGGNTGAVVATQKGGKWTCLSNKRKRGKKCRRKTRKQRRQRR